MWGGEIDVKDTLERKPLTELVGRGVSLGQKSLWAAQGGGAAHRGRNCSGCVPRGLSSVVLVRFVVQSKAPLQRTKQGTSSAHKARHLFSVSFSAGGSSQG
jgi:hypothetical protein